MKRILPEWRWQDGVVDSQGKHIELRYGDAGKSKYENWYPIARIGRPKNHVFPVEWLIAVDSPEHESMIIEARQELNFLLVEKGEPDPWAYAKYHCNTRANIYSRVHWSYFPNGIQGERHASTVTRLSSEEVALVFGDTKEPGKQGQKK
jgi:hypothetical protein